MDASDEASATEEWRAMMEPTSSCSMLPLRRRERRDVVRRSKNGRSAGAGSSSSTIFSAPLDEELASDKGMSSGMMPVWLWVAADEKTARRMGRRMDGKMDGATGEGPVTVRESTREVGKVGARVSPKRTAHRSQPNPKSKIA